jgi:hypothetical protein
MNECLNCRTLKELYTPEVCLCEDGPIMKFKDIQDDLIKALKPLAKDLNEEVNLIDGFISAEFLEELNDNPVLGGPTVPMVALISEKSGRLYFYSLRMLLPDLEIK